MTKPGDKANKFMRDKLGAAQVDAAAGSAGYRVIDGGGSGTEGDDAKSVPWIELPGVGRQLSAFARDVGAVLGEQDVFRRGKYPVLVDPETGMVEVITPQQFRSTAEEFAVFYKLKSRSAPIKAALKLMAKEGEPPPSDYDNEPASMTPDCAKGVLESPQFIRALRAIDRVNKERMPFKRSTGKTELLPVGYDAESKTYTLSSAVALDEKLTAAEGRTILRDYLGEFCFTDPRSLSVCVAGMFAVYCFHLQEPTSSRMSFIYRSNVPGAGKSLAAMFAIIPFFGLSRVVPFSKEEELQKLLDTTAMAGLPYIFLDNQVGHVSSKLLDAYLTTPMWGGRIMGGQKFFEAPANAMLFITGNGITVSDDIGRRSLISNLHMQEADSRERKIKRVITPQYLARPEVRKDILSAMWAMLQGWEAADAPRGSVKVPTFEEWSEMIGGIVQWNGFGDCLERPKDDDAAALQEVNKRHLVEKLVKGLDAGKTSAEYRFDELIEVCREHGLFDWIIDGKMVVKKEKRDDGGYDTTEIYQCDKETQSAMGKIFAKQMAGQRWSIGNGKKATFDKTKEGRHRRYLIVVK